MYVYLFILFTLNVYSSLHDKVIFFPGQVLKCLLVVTVCAKNTSKT